jgi:hypothetical protein
MMIEVRMNNALHMTAAVLLACAACLPAIATAQPAANAAAPRPDDSQASVPALVYQSPFARYRPLSEGAVGPWRAVNDEVGRIGGWKVYAREIYEESKQASPPPEGSGKPSSAPPDAGAQRAK